MAGKTFELKTNPEHGVILYFNEDGTYKYVPNPCYSGEDSFEVDVICNGEVEETKTITINVSSSSYPIYTETGRLICSDSVSLKEVEDTNKCSSTYGDKTFMPASSACVCDAKLTLEITGGSAPYKIVAMAEGETTNRVTSVFSLGNDQFEVYLDLVADNQSHTYNILVTDSEGAIVGTSCLNSYQCCGDFDIVPVVILGEVTNGTPPMISAFIAQPGATISIKQVGNTTERFISYDDNANIIQFNGIKDGALKTYSITVSVPGFVPFVDTFTATLSA